MNFSAVFCSLLSMKGWSELAYVVPGAKLNPGLSTGRSTTKWQHNEPFSSASAQNGYFTLIIDDLPRQVTEWFYIQSQHCQAASVGRREQGKKEQISAVGLQVSVWEVSARTLLRNRGVCAQPPTTLGKSTAAPLPGQRNGKLHLGV